MRLSFLTFPKVLTPDVLDGILQMIAMTREKFLASHLLKEVAGCIGSPHVGTGERLILASFSYGAEITYTNANELTFQGASDVSTFFILIEEVFRNASITRWFGVSENLKSFKFLPWGTTRIPVGCLKLRIGTPSTGSDPRMIKGSLSSAKTLVEILGTSGPLVTESTAAHVADVYAKTASDVAAAAGRITRASLPVLDFTITTGPSTGSDVTGTEADFA